MRKKGYYEYDPVIYPRMLCVAIGMSQEDANKCFEGRNGEVLSVDFSDSDAITYDSVREKANKKFCSFINFASKDSMRMGFVAMKLLTPAMPSKMLLVWSMAASLLPT